MCVQNFIALWCPYIPHACVRGTPGPYTRDAFRYESKGHIIARLVFTGAYIWCDDYVQSPNFAASFHINPPACPNGDLGTEYDHHLSRTLCTDCMGQGCSASPEEPSADGDASRRFKMTILSAPPESDITTSGTAKTKSSKKSKKTRSKTNAKTNGPAPLRVIDLREDDAADIARLKLQRAEKEQMTAKGNTEGQGVLPSAMGTEFFFGPRDWKMPAERSGETPRTAPVSPDGGEAGLDTPPPLVYDYDGEDESDDVVGEDEQRGDVRNTCSLPIICPPPRRPA
ncbi:hypothetical protein F5144DRAFT_639999 [Chaetomium tenue]|uniref:Uncharacterized protein n=1 Tax=Chaetomium tenue TaxID=1854479 RepID=A0ACB7PH16_9PEZI|nr:hypothetical protein F5144DRAFT_639999 [Chaetomium globosum]